MLVDRLTITGLFLLGYSAMGSQISLTPADTSASHTLNQSLIFSKYTMPGTSQVNNFQVQIRPLDINISEALSWSITGSDAQDGYINVSDFAANPAPADAEGYKLFTLGQPYESPVGSFEMLTLTATGPNAWQVKAAVNNNTFDLKAINSQPVPEASTATLGAIGLIASVFAFVFRRYQNAH